MDQKQLDDRLEEIRETVRDAVYSAREAEHLQALASCQMAKLCFEMGLAPGFTFDLWGDGKPKRIDQTTDIPPILKLRPTE